MGTVNHGANAMFHAITWSLVAMFVALWSLATWALHAVTHWTIANAGALSGTASQIGSFPVPEWLSPWLPPEAAAALAALMSDLGPMAASLLQAMPGLSSSVTVVAWVLWGIGLVLLLLLGVAAHVLASMWRRRGDRPGLQAGRWLPVR